MNVWCMRASWNFQSCVFWTPLVHACKMNVRWCITLVSRDRLGGSRLDDLTLHSHELWHFYSSHCQRIRFEFEYTDELDSETAESDSAALPYYILALFNVGTVETLTQGSTQQITGIFFSLHCAIVIEALTHNSVVSCYSRPLMLLLLSSATSALAKKGYGRPFSYLVLTPSLLWDFWLVFLDKSISSGSERLTNGMTIEHLFRHPEILSMW